MNTQAGPNLRDVVLERAKDLRAHRRIPEALADLARLQALHPRFSRLYQERGRCYIMLGDAPAAIAALQAAVNLNPTLPASWDMLAQLHRMTGDIAAAAEAARHLVAIEKLPADVVMANSLFADGDLSPAEAIIRNYLRHDDGNVGALRLLAHIRIDLGALDEAETLLASVLARAPDYDAARLDYVVVLLKRQKHQQARHEAGTLLDHDPDNREYLKHYSAACVGLGDHEPVIAIYDRLLTDAKSAAEVGDIRLSRANALKIIGRQAEAIADYRAALNARRDYGVAWFSLANLKTYRFADDELARMTAAEAQPDLQEMDRIYLCFALGKALEDIGDYASSFNYYERGNALRRSIGHYRSESMESCAVRLKHVFTAEFFSARVDWGVPDPSPIFIVGLPRAGSTLIEQILASHSRVEGTHELNEIGRYVGELCGVDESCGLPLRPESLRRLTAPDVREIGERYLTESRSYRRLDRPFFVDKMPNNFWHIGLIQLILPRATIIDVRREPMACCFSNFKQLFGAATQEFTYCLSDIARYYRVYLDLMQHWNTVLPGRVLRVHYEDVVDDLGESVQRMMQHCELAEEPECIGFHKTVRSVRTPSSEQVLMVPRFGGHLC